jgi:uncharacterized protein
MALHNAQSEPSMEEILASIRRIISEDEPKADDPSMEATPEPMAMESEPEAMDEGLDDLVVFDEPPPAPAPVKAAPVRPEPMVQMAAMEEDAIVSEPARAATADAFMRLSGALRISDHAGQTLEGLVRELLKPMLKDWLDANLAGIVETRVEAELNRISRLSA